MPALRHPPLEAVKPGLILACTDLCGIKDEQNLRSLHDMHVALFHSRNRQRRAEPVHVVQPQATRSTGGTGSCTHLCTGQRRHQCSVASQTCWRRQHSRHAEVDHSHDGRHRVHVQLSALCSSQCTSLYTLRNASCFACFVFLLCVFNHFISNYFF